MNTAPYNPIQFTLCSKYFKHYQLLSDVQYKNVYFMSYGKNLKPDTHSQNISRYRPVQQKPANIHPTCTPAYPIEAEQLASVEQACCKKWHLISAGSQWGVLMGGGSPPVVALEAYILLHSVGRIEGDNSLSKKLLLFFLSLFTLD